MARIFPTGFAVLFVVGLLAGDFGLSSPAPLATQDKGGGELRQFAGHTAAIVAVAFSPDGRHGFSASQDGTVAVRDLDTGKRLHRFEVGRVTAAAFATDGKLAATADEANTVNIWQMETGRLLRACRGHRERIASL